MKDKILKIIYNLNYKIFMSNNILLESNPDFSDNTKAVYDELINRKLNEKLKIIWVVDNNKKFRDVKEKNVKFIQRNKKILNKIRYIYYSFFSKYIMDCNKYIKKRNKNQYRIHLTHGATLKIPVEYCQQAGKIDCLIQLSDFFTNINSELFNIDKEKIITTGFPRNDIMFNNKEKLELFGETNAKKTICWLPTYRNHKKIKDNETFNMNIHFPFGIPTVNNIEEMKELDKFLNENEVLMLIKLHPAEDTTELHNYKFSNIKLIKDTDFEKEHKNIYNLLANVDALITDYSSVYYDFLLTDKLVGLAIPDVKEYTKHVKLLFDNLEENILGEYIYDFEDLIKFIGNVANQNDIKLKERQEKKKIYHKYFDNQSSKRVVDILEKNLF